jgi:dipeptidase E
MSKTLMSTSTSTNHCYNSGMRLFLSSYQAGKFTPRLIDFFGTGSLVGVITNARDDTTGQERAASIDEVKGFLQSASFIPVEIDLRNYFGKTEQLTAELQRFSNVWVAGGNTFILRRALKASGADNLLKQLINAGSLAYGGESAGAVVATPSLEGVELADDANDVPTGYDPGIIWQGLGLVKYHIVPHFQTGWLEIDEMAEVLKAKGVPYKTLSNDQVLIIDNDREELLG